MNLKSHYPGLRQSAQSLIMAFQIDAKVSQERLRFAKLRHELTQLTLKITQEVQAAYLNILEARQRIVAVQAALDEGKEVLRIEALKVQEGKSIIENLLFPSSSKRFNVARNCSWPKKKSRCRRNEFKFVSRNTCPITDNCSFLRPEERFFSYKNAKSPSPFLKETSYLSFHLQTGEEMKCKNMKSFVCRRKRMPLREKTLLGVFVLLIFWFPAIPSFVLGQEPGTEKDTTAQAVRTKMGLIDLIKLALSHNPGLCVKRNGDGSSKTE